MESLYNFLNSQGFSILDQKQDTIKLKLSEDILVKLEIKPIENESFNPQTENTYILNISIKKLMFDFYKFPKKLVSSHFEDSSITYIKPNVFLSKIRIDEDTYDTISKIGTTISRFSDSFETFLANTDEFKSNPKTYFDSIDSKMPYYYAWGLDKKSVFINFNRKICENYFRGTNVGNNFESFLCLNFSEKDRAMLMIYSNEYQQNSLSLMLENKVDLKTENLKEVIENGMVNVFNKTMELSQSRMDFSQDP